jgi:hypothetical protein
MDAMFFEHANIGEMYKIRLSLETHKPADWLCSLVEVLNLRTGMQSFFMPNGTLATTTVGVSFPFSSPPHVRYNYRYFKH